MPQLGNFSAVLVLTLLIGGAIPEVISRHLAAAAPEAEVPQAFTCGDLGPESAACLNSGDSAEECPALGGNESAPKLSLGDVTVANRVTFGGKHTVDSRNVGRAASPVSLGVRMQI